MKKKTQPEVIFAEMKGNLQPTIVDSMCVECQENGQTTLLLTTIPLFREIILSSFHCKNCGYKNNDVQFAGKLPDYGVDILFKSLGRDDLDREVIRSEHATLNFVELQLDIPANGRAQIITIEGILRRTHDQLKLGQPLRKVQDVSQHDKIQSFLDKLQKYLSGQIVPLTLRLLDPSGNSNIKNPFAPKLDKNLQITQVHRSAQDLKKMGYSVQNAQQEMRQIDHKAGGNKLNFTKPFEEQEFLKHESVAFEVPCQACLMPGNMLMCETSVPYFTDLVIMSFTCDHCGYHTAQTKNSGEIKEEGIVITLKVEGDVDLKRDLFKSETCAVNLPQIQLELDYGTLGGVFTTVEGLLEKIHDHLSKHNPFGDSDQEFGGRMQELLKDLLFMRQGKKPFTLILTDPLAQSFLQNPYLPAEDKTARRDFRARTNQENQMLGLNDIKVQNYKS